MVFTMGNRKDIYNVGERYGIYNGNTVFYRGKYNTSSAKRI